VSATNGGGSLMRMQVNRSSETAMPRTATHARLAPQRETRYTRAMTDRQDVLPAPPGFIAIPFDIGFIGVNGPLYVNLDGPKLKLGFRVEMRHCNPMRIAHGGMMATFIDMLMPFGIIHDTKMRGRFLPTIHLSQEFLAPAPLGSWVEGSAELLRQTRNLVFAQCLVTADGEPCGRASGIFKLGAETGGPGLSHLLDQLKAAPAAS